MSEADSDATLGPVSETVSDPPAGTTDEPAVDVGAAPPSGTIAGGAAPEALDASSGEPDEDPAGAEPAEGTEDTPRFVQVQVTSVVFTLPEPSPIVQLREVDEPYRTVYFPIGLAEAQAIALALEHELSPRPSTAELLSAVVTATNADVVAVRITAAKQGTMLAELDLMTPRGRSVLDCRPSDGIALVLRQHEVVPLLCEESLLDF
jgi:bifunctional DNase/RNase